eukprot:gnl/Spiro4/4359_TR2164_c0_g1_i1.p1 gnl/Spiro4/4359_TR2164_c0_g1~~gnl/Spiro4/4359_TR2164_c0_g1_i1.p1  ORF type:complete len:670 (-),score=117.79 gnl/Spiro4/4359_TR2164_c0_g1_i1:121-1950(-)
MLSRQKDLPKFPLPEIKATCERFLASVKLLQTPEQQAATTTAVSAFCDSPVSSELQQMLVAQRERLPNWLEPFWDDMYLEDPEPVCINSNYGFVFADPPAGVLKRNGSQTTRAALLVHSALEYYLKIRSETLDPIVEPNGTPLCMSEFPRMFCSNRTPGASRDRVGRPPLSGNAEYILVLRNHRFYAVRVLVGQEILEPDVICHALNNVVRMADEFLRLPPPVGTFTALPRPHWAMARSLLLAPPANRTYMDTLEETLFAVCLDTCAPETDTEAAETMLAGDPANRWFDKGIQLIVCANGRAGMNCEHAGFDGAVSLRLASFINERANAALEKLPAAVYLNVSTMSTSILPLEWEMTPDLLNPLRYSELQAANFFSSNETCTLSFESFGRKFLSAQKIGADAVCQLAIQLAHFRHPNSAQSATGFVSCYESASMKHYLHGRTETLRVVCDPVVQWVRAMSADGPSSTSERARLLRLAAAAHSQLATRCKTGSGVDRHIFGLRKMWAKAVREGLYSAANAPALFSDPGLTNYFTNVLSTSNCGSGQLKYFVFGPVTPTGFGIGYMVHDDAIRFAVCSKFRETPLLIENLRQALVEIGALLSEPTPLTSKL